MARAFTLIELLVVINIIALLIAILLPTLSRVKYETKMTVCSTQLRQAGVAAMSFAVENDGYYPYRGAVDDDGFSTPYIVRYRNEPGRDDTDLFRDLSLYNIACPFGNEADWGGRPIGTSIRASYNYFFGWESADPECQLLRDDQVMTFQGQTFDILASDILHHRDNLGLIGSGHPDIKEGLLSKTNSSGGWAWRSSEGIGRGEVDLNYARQDGSVFRLSNLMQADDRLKKVPYENSLSALNSVNTDYMLLPPRD